MKVEVINMEPVAVGLYSALIYTIFSIFFPSIRNIIWICFWTGVLKHISIFVLGLQNYFSHFYFLHHSRMLSPSENVFDVNLSKISILLIGAFMEGGIFTIIGYRIYSITEVDNTSTVFFVGIGFYFLTDSFWLQNKFGEGSILVDRKNRI
jgi:hypothetical protein